MARRPMAVNPLRQPEWAALASGDGSMLPLRSGEGWGVRGHELSITRNPSPDLPRKSTFHCGRGWEKTVLRVQPGRLGPEVEGPEIVGAEVGQFAFQALDVEPQRPALVEQ